jgi:hypothetical protein
MEQTSESIPLVPNNSQESPPNSPVDERKKSIGELDEAMSSPSSSPGSSPDQPSAIQMVPTRILKRTPDSPDLKTVSPDSPPKSALLSRRVSEVQKKKSDIIITIQTKEEVKSPEKRRVSERRRSSILYPKHNVQSPLPHFLDEVAPYEVEQVFGRASIQSPLPSALRRPSIKPDLRMVKATSVS